MGKVFVVLLCVFCLFGCESKVTMPHGQSDYMITYRDANSRILIFDAGLMTFDAAATSQFQTDAETTQSGDGSTGLLSTANRDSFIDGHLQAEVNPWVLDSGRVDPQEEDGCGGCDRGFVCLPQFERCVPDCRQDDIACPVRAPNCNEETGVCLRGAETDIPPGAGGVDSGVDSPDVDENDELHLDAGLDRLQDTGALGMDECGDCPNETVCQPTLARCVPDCRTNEMPCPPRRPVCQDETGLCLAAPLADGEAACEMACGRGLVCHPDHRRCVGDCRSIIGRCTPQMPICNPENGLCQIE